jgi:acyl-CoA reductase-like NAD-dependent aldehyde dehydrogenase
MPIATQRSSPAVHHSIVRGYLMAPIIVRHVKDDARIMREEQFGPILPVLSFTDVDAAIHRINDNEFGLAASVWGKDVEHANRVALRAESGTVWVNEHLDIRPDPPFRGTKQSRWGARTGARRTGGIHAAPRGQCGPVLGLH